MQALTPNFSYQANSQITILFGLITIFLFLSLLLILYFANKKSLLKKGLIIGVLGAIVLPITVMIFPLDVFGSLINYLDVFARMVCGGKCVGEKGMVSIITLLPTLFMEFTMIGILVNWIIGKFKKEE